jgi:hypothetical protein
MAAATAAACHKDAVVTTRAVTVFVPAGCPADGGAYATYSEEGDFDPAPTVSGHPAGAAGTTLAELDGRARALVVDATEGSGTWAGLGSVPPAGDVQLLLLPSRSSCGLTGLVGPKTGATLASIGPQRVMLAGGGGPTFVATLDTGVVTQVSLEPLHTRTRATVTAFGDGALLAGGTTPDHNVEESAEVYSNALGGFDQQPILLDGPRSNHGAVTLASGQTLLVGGVGSDGVTVLGSLEIVDPVTPKFHGQGLATLQTPRKDPTVLRLASGEVLIAGGTDAAGNPAQTVEWTEPDGTPSRRHTRPQTLSASAASAFIALPAGGALAVVAPPTGAPPGFSSVWVIPADGPVQAATPVPGSLTRPVLFGGAGGTPILWTGDRWLQWLPYDGAFGPFTVIGAAPTLDATCSPDGGLAMWLDPAQQQLTLLRFDVRNAYAPIGPALLTDDLYDTAPDRLASAGGIAFDAARGLTLGAGATVFVTDRTYADVAVDVDAPTGAPPSVVLRDELGGELEVGGLACPGAAAAGAPSLHVERHGASVAWSVAGGASGTCSGLVPGARLSVGVRGVGSGGSVARNLRVARLGGT